MAPSSLASAAAPQNGLGAPSPISQECCGLARLGLLGAPRDLGRAKRCSCPGYVTSWSIVVSTKGQSSSAVNSKPAQRSSLRLCARQKERALRSRGCKHDMEKQMVSLRWQEPAGTSTRPQAVEDLMEFCEQSPTPCSVRGCVSIPARCCDLKVTSCLPRVHREFITTPPQTESWV